MGQTVPLHSDLHSDSIRSIDHFSTLQRLVADLESGKTAIVTGGVDVTSAYVMVLKAQIQHLKELLLM